MTAPFCKRVLQACGFDWPSEPLSLFLVLWSHPHATSLKGIQWHKSIDAMICLLSIKLPTTSQEYPPKSVSKPFNFSLFLYSKHIMSKIDSENDAASERFNDEAVNSEFDQEPFILQHQFHTLFVSRMTKHTATYSIQNRDHWNNASPKKTPYAGMVSLPSVKGTVNTILRGS